MTYFELHEGKELLMQVASGNEFAFRKLFNLHHQRLGTYIFRITDSMEMAEEVVQDVFLKIWIKREALAQVENFNAYLFVISKNHALNCLRKQAKEWLLKKEWDNYVDTTVSVEDSEISKYYSLLDEAIDQLPPQQQKIFLLSRHERLKYTEIADRVDLSKETVKKYLQIATHSIKAYMQTKLVLPGVILLLLILF